MAAAPFVILYVEDDDLTRELFRELLATDQRRIVAVADGARARAALREHDVDLLITDVELPDDSGIEIAREAMGRKPGLPVVVCSGHDATAIVRALGPTAHALRKPVDVGDIEALLERLGR
jgi:DNA-binding NtrC family response regulator